MTFIEYMHLFGTGWLWFGGVWWAILWYATIQKGVKLMPAPLPEYLGREARYRQRRIVFWFLAACISTALFASGGRLW